jgi:hypothetical protein
VEEKTISKYDRLRGGLKDVALFTKGSTVTNIENITGKAETFLVETARYEDKGDYIFIQCLDDGQPTRICLPPRVANVIASQRESLTKRRRSITSRTLAKERMERGELPGFMRGKKQ